FRLSLPSRTVSYHSLTTLSSASAAAVWAMSRTTLPRPVSDTAVAEGESGRRQGAVRCQTPNPVKCPVSRLCDDLSAGLERRGDPVEIRLRQPRMEREGERAVETYVGAGEASLVAVGREPMERVGADLALDPLGSEGGQHLVAAVELDHV